MGHLGPFLEASEGCGQCGPSVAVGPGTILGNFDNEEALEGKSITQPITPSSLEVQIHERNHLPFRNWCHHCIRGRAKDDPHLKKELDKDREVVKISIDYFFMHEKEDKDRPASVEGEGLPMLIMKGSPHKEIFAFAVPKKLSLIHI